MAYTVEVFDGSRQEWDSFVQGHPSSANYHLLGWKDVIETVFGHRTYYLAARDSGRIIRGVLPLVHMKSPVFGNFLISVPFFNYGGILSDDNGAEAPLLEFAKNIMHTVHASFIEFRHARDRQGLGLVTKRHKVSMILDLRKDPDMQWNTFDAKLKNQIRKAIKEGLEIRRGGMALLDGFYSVFARNMRDLGTPVYPKVFFKRILETFGDTAEIFSVLFRKKVIASGMVTRYKKTLEMPWASSIRAFRPLCPNNLLYWEAIRYAIERGYSQFDFGRSTPGGATYKFKEQWGPVPVQLYWQYWTEDPDTIPQLNPSNPKYRAAIWAWQHLPLWVTRAVGPQIVKYIP
jgi:FemAB-related protein (PEP-CTERM system-associated)